MANEQSTESSKREPQHEAGASCGTNQSFNNTVGALAIAAAATLGYLAYVAYSQ